MTDFDDTSQKLMLVRRSIDTDKTVYDRPTGIIGAYRSYWKNFTNFRDRTSRSGYWWVILMNLLIAIALLINMYIAISGSAGSAGSGPSTFIASVETIAPIVIFVAWPFINIIPGLALTVRRLHDIGRTGYNYFFALIPVAGLIIMLVFLTTVTELSHNNRFGHRPQV